MPRRWRLKPRLDPDSFAHELLARGTPTLEPRKQSADAWFDHDEADEHEVLEQCVPGLPGKVLVALYLHEAEMFDEGYDADARW